MKKSAPYILLFFFIITLVGCNHDEPQGTTILIANNSGDGIYRATNFGTFIPSNAGLNGNGKYVRCFLDRGFEVLIGTKDGVYKSSDNGSSWKAINTGIGATSKQITSLMEIKGKVYAGSFGGGVYISENNGGKWEAKSSGLAAEGLKVSGLLYHNEVLYAATYNGMYRLEGDSWKEVNNGLTDQEDKTVVGITSKGSEVFIATSGRGVKKSKDKGENWIDLNEGLPDLMVNSIYANDTTLLIGTSEKGVYRYADKTWKDLNNGLTEPGKKIRSIAAKKGVMVIGTVGGAIYHSDDNGFSWEETSGNAITGDVWGILIR